MIGDRMGGGRSVRRVGLHRGPACITLHHMTVRITVSLPDDVHAAVTRVAAASHISTSSVVRAILSDVIPKMTGILDYLGTIDPADAKAAGAELDAWAAGLRDVLHDAPPVLGGFRNLLDEAPEKGEES